MGGAVNMNAYVQHLILLMDLKGDTEWMMNENQMGVFTITLQDESTSLMEWVLYTMNTLDIPLLTKLPTDECSDNQIALKFKHANTNKYELDRDEQKMNGYSYQTGHRRGRILRGDCRLFRAALQQNFLLVFKCGWYQNLGR